jgi:branched-chain amino acid transport system ATP-binding protein
LALATNPEIVFLDEPAAGVNPDETEGLAILMKKMALKGITVCLIEHKMQMIMKLADKIMVLNYGEKIAEGKPEEIQNNQAVIKAYLGGGAIA